MKIPYRTYIFDTVESSFILFVPFGVPLSIRNVHLDASGSLKITLISMDKGHI